MKKGLRLVRCSPFFILNSYFLFNYRCLRLVRRSPFLILIFLIFTSYFGRLNALVISAICSSVMPSGSKPMHLASM